MPFNGDKWKVMHIRPRNCNTNYSMQGKPLKVVNEESDFGVTISNDLKFAKNCKSVCEKANMMLGFIARNFKFE